MNKNLALNSKAFSSGLRANYILFFCAGMTIAPWAAIAPLIKDYFELSAGLFAIMSACFGGGALVSMLCSGILIKKFGVIKVAAVTLFLTGLAVFLVSFRLLPWFCIYPSALLWGGAVGVYEVSCNVHATLFEDLCKRRLLSKFTAANTVGCIFATLFYPFLLKIDTPVECISLGGLILSFGSFLLVKPYLVDTDGQKDVSDEDKNSLQRIKLSPQGLSGVMILVAGTVSFLALLTEGSVYDWSGVYLVHECALPLTYAAFGFLCYEGTAGVVRFFGEKLLRLLGPMKLVCGGSVVACIALMIAGLSQHVAFVLLGFTLLGAAAGNVMPVIISEVGRRCIKDKASTIGTVSAMGYAGVLAGPALLGVIATFINYASIFTVVGGLMVVMLVMAYKFLSTGRISRQKL